MKTFRRVANATCVVCLIHEVNVNSPTIVNEDQVQDFIDYITQKSEVRFDVIKYLTCEWQVNPTQRRILQHLRKAVGINVPGQAILFLLCSKGLSGLEKGMEVILLRDNIDLQNYLETIELIVLHCKGFQFNQNEIEIIVNRAVELLKREKDPSIRVLSVKLLYYCLYVSQKSRHFASIQCYLRDFAKSDVSSITDLVTLHDYYQSAYAFFHHFSETDSGQVQIRDLLIDATKQKMDNLSKDFSEIVKPIRCSISPTLKKKICFLSHKTSLYSPYANTRSFYGFLKGLHSSSADKFDFYWYAIETATDETVEELESMDVKVRRFDKIADVQEKIVCLLNSFENDEIDVVVNDYPNFWVILLYSIRVAPVQIYFCLGFVYFEFEGVDHLLLPKEGKSNGEIKTNIIGYESYNWLESRFLEGPNSKEEAQSNLDITFNLAVKQLVPQAKYVIGCYGRFEKINEEYLSVIKMILNKQDDVIFFVFGPGDQLLVTNYFARNGLQDRVIISGTSDPHVFGWAFDVFCEQWPFWSGQSSLEVMAKGIPVVSYICGDFSLWSEPYSSLRDLELVTTSHREYVDKVIRLLEDKEYYKIKQDSVKEISKKVTNLDERAGDVGKQILLVLERTLK